MKKILVTGGTGYLGGRISSYLKDKFKNIDIILTVEEKTNLPSWSKEFEIRTMNLLDEKSIESSVEGIDSIIHLAALNEIVCAKDPDLAFKVNVEGTKKIIDAGVKCSLENFVYLSTFHGYGLGSGTNITEKSVGSPTHPYAITKREAEKIVLDISKDKKINSLIFRLSNGFGYPMDEKIDRWTLIINDLCKQLITTKKIVLNSSGKQHRDFISIGNITRALEHFMNIGPESWKGEIYNLGGEQSLSILDVAHRVIRNYESLYTETIEEVSTKNDDTQNISPIEYSIEKLKSTGFKLVDDMDKEIIQCLKKCEHFVDKGGF